MLSFGTVVLTVEDIDRAGAFWRAALGYVNRLEPTDDWVMLDPPVQGALERTGREHRAVGHRVSAALPAAHPPRPVRRGSGRRGRAAAGHRRTGGRLARLSGGRRLDRARGHRGQPLLRRRHESGADGRRQRSAASARRIASRSGLPDGSVASSSTSTSRDGRACGPISADDRGARLFELHGFAAAQRFSARCDDDGCLAPARVRNAHDDGAREAGHRAHDALDAVERDVHPARDDDVVDAAADAQHAVLDEPGVAGAVPPAAVVAARNAASVASRIAEVAVGERRTRDLHLAVGDPHADTAAADGRRRRSRRSSRSSRRSARSGRPPPARAP